MQTVRTLQESIETLKKDLQVSAAKESSANVSRSPFQPIAGTKSVEEAQKEILDAEIELYQKQQEGSDTTELQKRVQELQTIMYMSLRGSSTGRRGLGRASLRGALRGRGRGSVAVRGSRGRYATQCINQNRKKGGKIDRKRNKTEQSRNYFLKI